ncbi:MAG TPA: M20/M25/M40 family metallo-hydrolase [Chitinophagaceae bacterium]
MRVIVFLLSLACIAATGSAQSLSKEEQQVVRTIHENLPRHLALLQQVVDINSGTLNVAGVRATGDVFRKEFDRIGFTTEWISMPDSMKRAGHLVASIKGNKGKKLFLIGHLDTVFEPDMPANPYRKVNDSTITGQGVEDMKGGDVVVLAALEALQQNGLLDDAAITAYFTGDEEKSGSPESISRGDFIERARRHDIALAFEGAIGSTIATGRRGSSGWQLKVYGKQGHSSGVFHPTYGAIYETARILNEFRLKLSAEPYLSFNPGIIAGGTELHYDSARITGTVSGKTNIISPYCITQGDLRFLSEKQKLKARARMLAIVNGKNLPGTRAEIRFYDGIPAMEPTEGNLKLARMLSKVSVDLGYGPIRPGDPAGRGAGDISYIAQYVDALDGLGSEGWGGHAPGETMSLSSFERQVQRAAILIYRLTR